MRRPVLVCVAGLALISLVVTPLAAEPEWCSGFTDSIFCFDFDRACPSPPPYPETCVPGTARSDPAIRGVWAYNSWNVNTQSSCGSNMCGEETPTTDPPSNPYGYILPTHPYGGRHANGGDEGGTLGQNTVDLTPYIEFTRGGYTLTNGTDAQPLVLTFTMGSLALGAMQFNNGYMELGLGDQDIWNPVSSPVKAPTDFILVGADDILGCTNCNATCTGGATSVSMISWPTVCQQEFPHPSCPVKQTFVRTALAVGALAMLDNNPCHCCTVGYANPNKPWQRQCVAGERTPDFPDGWQEPTNWHLSYFDGVEWRVLKAGMGGPGSYGDFHYGNYWIYWRNPQGVVVGNTDSGWEEVRLTVKTSTVDIYHKTKMMSQVDGQWVATWVESLATDLPRRYQGDFNRLRAGTDESCRLIKQGDPRYTGTYACDPDYANGHRRCKVLKEERCDPTGGNATYRSSYVAFDNVRLYGGIAPDEIGACCTPDHGCTTTAKHDCWNGVFRGNGTTCDTPNICDGACCLPQNGCTQTGGQACTGDFRGAGTSCATQSCCPTPFADWDWDRDVDMMDFAALQQCLTSGTPGAAIAAACQCFDRDGDDLLGDLDVQMFVSCATGPSIQWTGPGPGCIP